MWTYGIYTGGITPYQYEPYYLEVKEEIYFKSKLCKSIIRTSYNGFSEAFDLLYQEEGSVYFYNEELDSFILLFDFGAKQFDTLQIGLDRYYNEEELPYIKVIVDSISLESYCGEQLQVWYLSTLQDFHHYTFESKVIEKIGFLGSFHPVSGLYCGDIGSLRCFEESNYYCKLVDYDCDTFYYTSSINKLNIEKSIEIFPNPASNEINVKLPESSKVTSWSIYNLYGQNIKTGEIKILKLKTSLLIPKIKITALGDLESGVYFLQLNNETSTFEINDTAINNNGYVTKFLIK